MTLPDCNIVACKNVSYSFKEAWLDRPIVIIDKDVGKEISILSFKTKILPASHAAGITESVLMRFLSRFITRIQLKPALIHLAYQPVASTSKNSSHIKLYGHKRI